MGQKGTYILGKIGKAEQHAICVVVIAEWEPEARAQNFPELLLQIYNYPIRRPR